MKFGLEYLGYGISDSGFYYFGFMFMNIIFYIDENGKEVLE